MQITFGGFDLDNRRSSVVYKSYKRLASRGSFFAYINRGVEAKNILNDSFFLTRLGSKMMSS